MSMQLNSFVIQEIAYEDLPNEWVHDFKSSGVQGETVPTVDNYNVRITPARSTSTVLNNEQRIIKRNVWLGQWDTMDLNMKDHLLELYSSDTLFYIKYDDVMSRNAVKLESINKPSERRTFWTPTYPAFPYDYPDNLLDKIYLYNTHTDTWVQLTAGYNQLAEEGQIILDTAVAPWVDVYMWYTWRARVRIRNLNLNPKNGVAKDVYTGVVEFEQAPLNSTYDDSKLYQDNQPKTTYTEITEPTGALLF